MAVITLEYAKNLANKGFTNEQAEALALENKRLLLLQWGMALIILVEVVPTLKSWLI